MRRRPRVDGNHPEIVRALRQVGATVESLASVGGGVPDLLVGFHGLTVLLEVKDGRRPPSERKLTEAEKAFLRDWRGGPALVVGSVEAALAAIGAYPGTPEVRKAPRNANTGHSVRRRVIG